MCIEFCITYLTCKKKYEISYVIGITLNKSTNNHCTQYTMTNKLTTQLNALSLTRLRYINTHSYFSWLIKGSATEMVT